MSMPRDVRDRLEQIYQKNPSNFKAFAHRVKNDRELANKKIPQATLRRFLSGFSEHQITKEYRRPYRRRAGDGIERSAYSTIWADRPQARIQMDILVLAAPKSSEKRQAELQRRGSKRNFRDYAQLYGGFRYALLAIDVKSRKVWAKLLRDRNSNRIREAVQEFLRKWKSNIHGKPKSINADQEFANRETTNLLRDEQIDQFLSSLNETNKNALVERLNRTIRREIRLQLRRSDRRERFGANFQATFSRIIDDHNKTPTRTTGEAPNDVNDGTKESLQGEPPVRQFKASDRPPPLPERYKDLAPQLKHTPKIAQQRAASERFRLGQHVRHRITFSKFTKASSANTFTPEIFVIDGQTNGARGEGTGQSFFLKPLRRNGTLGQRLGRPFRAYELQSVPEAVVDTYLAGPAAARPQRGRGQRGGGPARDIFDDSDIDI